MSKWSCRKGQTKKCHCVKKPKRKYTKKSPKVLIKKGKKLGKIIRKAASIERILEAASKKY